MTKAPGMALFWRHSRRRVFVRYLLILTAISLVWEFAQMPLYTLAETGTLAEIVFSGLHCTIGDAMIGGAALAVAVAVVGKRDWPVQGRAPVLLAAVILGLGYTVFSEWLNIEVRGAWAYSGLMPVVPVIGTGLSPLLQWLVLPVVAHCLANREQIGTRNSIA